MGDLEILQSLKRMLEKKDREEADNQEEKEKKFIADATKAYLGDNSSVSSIKGYDPAQMIAFLSLPTKEVQKRMGGEWAEMDSEAFDLISFYVQKKIQKSTEFIDWKS